MDSFYTGFKDETPNKAAQTKQARDNRRWDCRAGAAAANDRVCAGTRAAQVIGCIDIEISRKQLINIAVVILSGPSRSFIARGGVEGPAVCLFRV
jgi:hypothetical protein